MNKTRLEAFSGGVIATPIAFGSHRVSKAIYVIVALMWRLPNRRPDV